jgi:3-oxoacyl-[acyl-carrier-protein] synthase-3
MAHAVLAGLGAFVPSRRITNLDLSATLDTSDEWITSRTGIRERRWAQPGQSTGDLAVEAGRRALKSAGLGDGADIGLVVVATTTPDHHCPATAPEVASRLGLRQTAAFDLAAVCSGFVYALETAANALVARSVETALVIGAETYSTILDPKDRGTTVIFGDGAGAVVLRRGERDEPGALLDFDLGSDGGGRDLIQIPGGGSRHPDAPRDERYFTMQGAKVFARAVSCMGDSAQKLLSRLGWPADSIGHVVAHQANARILRAVAERLGIPAEKAYTNLQRVGNTSAASIPLALADAAKAGELQFGERVLLTAFGGGLTWGSAALTWPEISTV